MTGAPSLPRGTFTSRAATVAAMVGVAIGLGNFWRFPYLVGRYGGAAFVLFYLLCVLAIGVPGLMAEWALGRSTRRGTAGAYAAAGLPYGRALGWLLFAVVLAATAYYAVAVGWVAAYAAGQLLAFLGARWDPAVVLPPETGFDPAGWLLQAGFTGAVLLLCALVLARGLRGGIERASRLFVPLLAASLLVLIARGLALPGALEGLRWYLLKFQPSDLTGGVMLAALGQTVFSLALGGTFMVVYGSYLADDADLPATAAWTAGADTAAGLLAGLAIFPAVFALGLEPGAGPGLIFDTLPRVFARLPFGGLFGAAFFLALLAGAVLSTIGALEVLVAGLTDNTGLGRTRAVALCAAAAFLLALAPMVNLRVFVPWDLAFGSGMQTLGALAAVLTVGWALDRSAALAALSQGAERPVPAWLLAWLRWVVPGAILAVGVWWLLGDLLGLVGPV